MPLRMIIISFFLYHSSFHLRSISVDLNSFKVFGIATDIRQSELFNNSRPILVQPSLLSLSNPRKLLQIKFETNPLNKKCDYLVEIFSQSLELTYNAV